MVTDAGGIGVDIIKAIFLVRLVRLEMMVV